MAADDRSYGIGDNGGPPIETDLPEKVLNAFVDDEGNWRYSFYKMLYGGRGSAKSETWARLLIAYARSNRGRVLCARQYMNSIKDSVHQTLVDAINEMGVAHEFKITEKSIVHRISGTDFIFKGFQRDIGAIKSMKGLTRCFVEEANTVSKEAWQVLEPTMRGSDDAEIWVAFNPESADDPIYRMSVSHLREDAIAVELNYVDNPFFPEVLNRLRLYCLTHDQDAYDWIWLGHVRKISAAQIFKNRVFIETFDEPEGVQPLYGLDFGFSNDPTAGVRIFEVEGDGWKDLYVSHEAGGIGVENDQIIPLLRGELVKDQGLPDVDSWPLKADCSAPATISHLVRHGMPMVSGAAKWAGSVEDGIRHLKGYRRIVVHPRCVQTAQEFRLYSYKVDKHLLDAEGNPCILPTIVDAWNHYVDAIRYALDGRITGDGDLSTYIRAMQ